MKPSVKILTEARALLARRGGWIKKSFSIKKSGGQMAYCALGALNVVSGIKVDTTFIDVHENPRPGYFAARRALAKAAGTTSIPAWQDGSRIRKKDVLTAFDRAIENLS